MQKINSHRQVMSQALACNEDVDRKCWSTPKIYMKMYNDLILASYLSSFILCLQPFCYISVFLFVFCNNVNAFNLMGFFFKPHVSCAFNIYVDGELNRLALKVRVT